MMWFSLIVSALCLNIGWSNAACPKPEVLSPCTCKQVKDNFGSGDAITCQGSDIKNMKVTFDRVSDNRKESERHFYKLLIRNTLIDHLESGLIGKLTFDSIEIGINTKLRKIHSSAFSQSAARVKSFALYSSRNYSLSPAPYNLFDMLNSFVNVKQINIGFNNITSIPDRAFYNLTNLTILALNGQRINHFAPDAFKFKSESKQNLTIYCQLCNLTALSFASKWINNIIRTVDLNLFANKITYLDQKMFKPFLDDKRNNGIKNLERNPLNCSDCRNAWLEKVQVKDKYKKQVLLAHCGGSRFNRTIFQSDFGHCK